MTEIHVTIRVRLPNGAWRIVWGGDPVSQVCVEGRAEEAMHTHLGSQDGNPEVVINPGWPGAEGAES